ncbi:hypothetical protein GXW83_11660 [Streptacidiphilus sp. PB12-B1b]|uniref:DUF6643 family protein n=1 Tax=Streptacidiphilus sp. PB12-B1b TaxID=2705012 RepID=UPI0015F9302F|nr:DUF6643 family protein [Streptacidiphilus sp. PB12-B1b]QMU76302.1 hypothetical protein GXW83_11660 [Streptacidiphilus sp. PB12-B1b]
MTSPRRYDGVGYYAPSFASDTPIYDSLVAERGVPQIAPINVPAALPPAYDNGYRPSTFGGNLPALPAPRLALGPGPSSPGYSAPGQPQPQYAAQPFPSPQYGAPQFGAPQFAQPQYGAPQPQIPQQQGPGQQFPQQPAPAPAYQRPVAPVAPLRPVQYQEQYPQQQRGGYQGF